MDPVAEAEACCETQGERMEGGSGHEAQQSTARSQARRVLDSWRLMER